MPTSAPVNSSGNGSSSSQSLSLNSDEITAIYEGTVPLKDVATSSILKRFVAQQEERDAENQRTPTASSSRKRLRSSEDEEEEGGRHHNVLSSPDTKESYMNTHTYGASRFGDFGEYMTRKRAKLQVQNAEITNQDEGGDHLGKIFNGLQIYVRNLLLWKVSHD